RKLKLDKRVSYWSFVSSQGRFYFKNRIAGILRFIVPHIFVTQQDPVAGQLHDLRLRFTIFGKIHLLFLLYPISDQDDPEQRGVSKRIVIGILVFSGQSGGFRKPHVIENPKAVVGKIKKPKVSGVVRQGEIVLLIINFLYQFKVL